MTLVSRATLVQIVSLLLVDFDVARADEAPCTNPLQGHHRNSHPLGHAVQNFGRRGSITKLFSCGARLGRSNNVGGVRVTAAGRTPRTARALAHAEVSLPR